MTIDEKLLDRICLTDAINECVAGGKDCSECDYILREMIAEHDKEVIQNYIDKVVKKLEDSASRHTKKYTTPYGVKRYKDVKAISVNKAIEIVKAGGDNETN